MPKVDRVHYYDIARGLLIFMVVYYHTMLAVDIPFATSIWNQFGFISFFMAGFFIITGLVTNFSRDSWHQFLWKKFKGIIIPTITFLFVQHWLPVFFDPTAVPPYFGLPIEIFCGELPWFISALFFSLIINYALIRNIPRKRYILLLSLCLYLLGVVSHTYGWIKYQNGDIYCIDHILTMNIFLTIGHLFRGVNLKWWYILLTVPIFEAVIFSTNFLPFGIPFVTGGTLYVDYYCMIPFLVMAICGSITLLILCKYIGGSSVLEYVGRHTLGIYVLQGALILPLLQILLLGRTELSEYSRTVIFFLVVLLVILISSMISQLLNSKYLKWCMGKF